MPGMEPTEKKGKEKEPRLSTLVWAILFFWLTKIIKGYIPLCGFMKALKKICQKLQKTTAT